MRDSDIKAPTVHHAQEVMRSHRQRIIAWLRRFTVVAIRDTSLVVKGSILILIGFVFVGTFARLLVPYAPSHIDLLSRAQPPMWVHGGGAHHILGTDVLGRDILSRLIDGTRITLLLTVISIAVGAILGSSIGLISGIGAGIPGSIWGKLIDILFMRFTDLVLAVPIILIALLLAVVFGPSFRVVLVVTSVFLWSAYARVVRTEAIAICAHSYIDLALIAGVSRTGIGLRHVLPNVLAPIIVLATLQVGFVILFASALSFLGAGVPPPQATWGGMVADGRSVLSQDWWIATLPGILIAVVVFAANSLGDWLRDTLDPRMAHVPSW